VNVQRALSRVNTSRRSTAGTYLPRWRVAGASRVAGFRGVASSLGVTGAGEGASVSMGSVTLESISSSIARQGAAQSEQSPFSDEAPGVAARYAQISSSEIVAISPTIAPPGRALRRTSNGCELKRGASKEASDQRPSIRVPN
jgi:hypothetical protein